MYYMYIFYTSTVHTCVCMQAKSITSYMKAHPCVKLHTLLHTMCNPETCSNTHAKTHTCVSKNAESHLLNC